MDTITGHEARERLIDRLPVAERRMELAGIETAVLEGGDGPPVVLLHGPGQFAAAWFAVIPELTATHRVIAPDLPGHGASRGDGLLDVVRVLEWLDALIERTCPAPPALVGHVVGGAIAARYAARRDARIARLVLVDALGLVPFQPAPAFWTALNEFLEQPSGASHDRFWGRCAFDLDGLRAALGDRWESLRAYNLDRASAPESRAAMQALMAEFGMPAIPPGELAAIAVPVSLVWGRHDVATPLAVAEAASARHGWPLAVVEDAAADPMLERPEEFLEALRVALEERRPVHSGRQHA